MYNTAPVPIPQCSKGLSVKKIGNFRYVYYNAGFKYNRKKKKTIPLSKNIGKVKEDEPGMMYPNENYAVYFPDAARGFSLTPPSSRLTIQKNPTREVFPMSLTYFDYAATTPVHPAAAEALLQALSQFGNPSSRYPIGRETAAAVKAHREVIAKALGCSPAEVVFTSGGTEGDNWAIRKGVESNRRKGKHIITTAIEHAAVLETCKDLERQGYELTVLKPDRTGRIQTQQVLDALRPDTALISMMAVNNETGVILPVQEMVQAVRAKDPNVLIHCDAVQGFLKLPIPLASTGADFIAISGHKVGAPKGIGALYIRKGRKLAPLLTGGGQEEGLRSGTEPTAQIAAFAAAVEAMSQDKDRLQRTADIKAYTLEKLQAALPKLQILSPGDAPHITAVSLPGYKSEVVVRVLGDQGICISSGSACHKGKPSHVFAAMGLPKPILDGALRLSFSPDSTREEADRLVAALSAAAGQLFTTLS